MKVPGSACLLGLGFSSIVSDDEDDESADEEDVMLAETQVLVLESHSSDVILKLPHHTCTLSHSHRIFCEQCVMNPT